MPSIFDKLGPVLTRYDEIEAAMGRPEVATDFEQVQTLAKERASLETLVDIAHRHQNLVGEQDDLNSLLEPGSDAELTRMAKEELVAAERHIGELEAELKIALLPKDHNDERDVKPLVRQGI